MMSEQTNAVENNYLNQLYKDLNLKSAMDINATIDIISRIEDLSQGENYETFNGMFAETLHLPGKAPMELIAEFKKFWATHPERHSLSNILELRNSLYRFQSLD